MLPHCDLRIQGVGAIDGVGHHELPAGDAQPAGSLYSLDPFQIAITGLRRHRKPGAELREGGMKRATGLPWRVVFIYQS